jgi:tubulin-specific chaperone B
MLGYYSVRSGMEIHIVDTDPYSLSRNGGLTDVSLVEKFKISEEAYEKRKGTVRDFIRNKRKDDPNYKVKPVKGPVPSTENEASVAPIDDASTVEGITVGMRCEVNPGERRGIVRFVGEIPEISSGGIWVGVEFDEPLGHNDGTVKGRELFKCLPKHGAFIRGKNLKVGDFPERDLFADDDEEEEKDEKLENKEVAGVVDGEQENKEDEDEI